MVRWGDLRRLLWFGLRTKLRAVRYLDPSKPVEKRISDLLGRMTLDERTAQLNHLNTGIPRLGIPAWSGWNQTLHGVWSKQPATLFPVQIAMGATWDPALVRTVRNR